MVIQLGLAVLLDECIAVGVVHLSEELLAKLVILLDGLAPVDLPDDALLLGDVVLQLRPVPFESGVARNHVEALEPALAHTYFLSVFLRILLSLL